MSASEIETLKAGDVAEVKAFLKVQKAVEELARAYPAAYRKLLEVAPKYNASLKAADEACRKRIATCGPFVVERVEPMIDAEKLAGAIGDANFTRLGGTIELVKAYAIERPKVLAALERGEISTEARRAAITPKVYFDKPKPLSLP